MLPKTGFTYNVLHYDFLLFPKVPSFAKIPKPDVPLCYKDKMYKILENMEFRENGYVRSLGAYECQLKILGLPAKLCPICGP